jgi:hypothetical protein
MRAKDKKIIEDSEHEGIPIFVLVAKDKLSTEAIVEYFNLCKSKKCKDAHLSGILSRLSEFVNWQEQHPDKLRLPD